MKQESTAQIERTEIFYVPRCGVCDNDVRHCDYCKGTRAFHEDPNSQTSEEIICVHTKRNYIGRLDRTRHFCSEECMEAYFKEYPELKGRLGK
jgi:hypothetical protein